MNHPRTLVFSMQLNALIRTEAAKWASSKLNIAVYFASTFFLPLSILLQGVFGSQITANLAPFNSSYLQWLVAGLIVEVAIMQPTAKGTSQTLRIYPPIGVITQVLGKSVWYFVLAAVNVSLYLTIAFLGFGVSLDVNLPFLLIVLLDAVVLQSSVVLLSTSSNGLMGGANPIQLLLNYAPMLLSGIVFPIAILPPYVQNISLFFPETYVYYLFRLSLLRGSGANLLSPATDLAGFSGGMPPLQLAFIAMVLETAVFAVLGFLANKKSLARARQMGALYH